MLSAKDQKGFSLVEVLVGSAIVAILGITLYSVFATSQNQLQQTTSQLRMVEASNWLQSEYHHLALASGYAFSGLEYANLSAGGPVGDTNTGPASDKVIFLSQAMAPFAYKALFVQNGWLYEKAGVSPIDTAGGWSVVKIGRDSVRIGVAAPFILLPGRRKTRFQPGNIRIASNLSDSLLFAPMTIACRLGRL